MEQAIYQDCHNLIEKFVAIGLFEFSSFCREWKKSTFQHMYSYQTSVVEVMLSTAAMYHMAKRTICAKDKFGKFLKTVEENDRGLLRRIGGLYLLYAIYFKQPTRQFIKVQVSMETWCEMTAFIESLKSKPRLNCARYMFLQLYKSDAFRFTGLDYLAGLEDLVDYDNVGNVNAETQFREILEANLQRKLNSMKDIRDNVGEMTKMQDEYNSIKQKINGIAQVNNNEPAEINGNQVNNIGPAEPALRIFHDIQDVFNTIENIINDIPEQTEDEPIYISTTRMAVKRKAAGLRDYKELQCSDDEDDSDSICETFQQEETNKVKKKVEKPRITKPSTIFSQNLSDDMTNDLMGKDNA